MENRKQEIRLNGRWRVVRRFVADDEAGKSLTLFDDYFVEFATGDILIETHGDEVTTTTYRFDVSSGTIEILAVDEQPSPIFGAGSTTFRVVPLNDCEMYLRKPHSVEVDGESEMILLSRHGTL